MDNSSACTVVEIWSEVQKREGDYTMYCSPPKKTYFPLFPAATVLVKSNFIQPAHPTLAYQHKGSTSYASVTQHAPPMSFTIQACPHHTGINILPLTLLNTRHEQNPPRSQFCQLCKCKTNSITKRNGPEMFYCTHTKSAHSNGKHTRK